MLMFKKIRVHYSELFFAVFLYVIFFPHSESSFKVFCLLVFSSGGRNTHIFYISTSITATE